MIDGKRAGLYTSPPFVVEYHLVVQAVLVHTFVRDMVSFEG